MTDTIIPARKIKITNRSVSGVFPETGRYESSLERDFMEILRFDSSVDVVHPQPITIEYSDKNGKKRKYTPDGLIHFRPEYRKPPILYEIKYRDDFRDNWRVILAKFRAAKSYCMSEGWQFCAFTEREIRTQFLKNARFLWPYKNISFAESEKLLVLNTLSDLEEADPELLLCAIYRDKTNRAKLIPVLWHLIANDMISCDLDSPLNMRSTLRSKGEPS